MQIERDVFKKFKYNCPSYDITYGAKCPLSNAQCSYYKCPIVYWINIISKKEEILYNKEEEDV